MLLVAFDEEIDEFKSELSPFVTDATVMKFLDVANRVAIVSTLQIEQFFSKI